VLLTVSWTVPAGLNLCEAWVGKGNVDSEKFKPGSRIDPESLLLLRRLPLTEPTREGELDNVLPGSAI